jgi:hypothetical protein
MLLVFLFRLSRSPAVVVRRFPGFMGRAEHGGSGSQMRRFKDALGSF